MKIFRDKVSLNVLANEATFALIDRVLARGVDVREVRAAGSFAAGSYHGSSNSCS